MKNFFTDQEIITGLRKGGTEETAVLRFVYQSNRPAIWEMVRQNSGSVEEAKDVFQEAVLAFYENVQADKFNADSKVSTYLFGIARFIWLNRLKRNGIGQKIKAQLEQNVIDPGFLPSMLKQEQEELVNQFFLKLGEKCRQVLSLSFYRHFSMQEIAAEMGFDNEQVARNKKYQCLKKLKSMIKSRPEILQTLNLK